ncbi:HAD family hydrolase [Neisseriaceae bacterium ESL0693]|nr:HAD family hydrolase [Neisseriaceae bacterium ESL0693]
MIQAVLFDLDGTLADTARDLGGALNRLLQQHHLPPKTMAAIREVASRGAAALIELGTGITSDNKDYGYWREAFLAEYDRHLAEETVLFDGINEVIHALQQQCIQWGIVTNKPRRFTDRLVPELGFVHAPAVVVSGDTTDEAKPSVKPMLHACQSMHVKPEQCVYVGDALRDIQAGKNAGMKTILANWGYIGKTECIDAWGADHLAARPQDILSLISM